MELDGTIVRASELSGRPASMQAVLACLPEGSLVRSTGIPEPLAQMELQYHHPQYRQAFEGFQSQMSTLDLLFNYGPESARILQSGSRLIKNQSLP